MTKIEWTDSTWNPVAGCSEVSPGCHHCYARTMARRLEAMGSHKYAGTVDPSGRRWSGRINFDEGALLLPFGWGQPRAVFVNSMSDLFHRSLPFERVDEIFAVMALNGRHTYQVLTKRAARMRQYFSRDDRADRIMRAMYRLAERMQIRDFLFDSLPLPHVWLGVSVEDQQRANERIPYLIETPAAIRFLSIEPLLGPVDLFCPAQSEPQWDWVIVGGESGPGARPMAGDWVRKIRDDCVAAGVPFFFKQWGGVQKQLRGRLLDGREWNEMPTLESVTYGT